MKTQRLLVLLVLLTALLAGIYSAVGLFSSGGPGEQTVVNNYGETVTLYGRGIYRHDSVLKAPIFRGTDAVTLFNAVPALLIALWAARRGGLGACIFLTGMLAYFIYNAASLALGAAFNPLLLVYIAAASASLYAFILAFRSIDLEELARRSAGFPRVWAAVFLVLGALSLVIWIVDILGALIQATVPTNLDHYHTESTYVLDLAVLLPALCFSAWLVWRRKAAGYLLAFLLIGLNLFVGLVVVGQTGLMIVEGLVLSVKEMALYVAPFVLLGALAAALLVSMYRSIRVQ